MNNPIQFIELQDKRGNTRAVGFHNGKLLINHLEVNELNYNSEKAKRVINNVLIILSLTLFVFSLVNIALVFASKFPASLSKYFFGDELTGEVRLFWFGVLLIFYVIYIATSSAQKYAFFADLKSGKLANPPQLTNYEMAKKFSSRYRVDVLRFANKNAKNLIYQAQILSKKYHHDFVSTLTLTISAIAYDKSSQIILGRLGISGKDFVTRLIALASEYTGQEGRGIFGAAAERVLISSYVSCLENKMENLVGASILVNAVKADQKIQDVLFDLGISLKDVENAFFWTVINQRLSAQYRKYRSAGKRRSKYGMDRAMTSMASQFLNQFGTDLTRQAQLGYADITVARDNEIDELFRIFETGTKNIALIGKMGVGKSAIVEGLAEKIIGNDVPKFLQEKRLVSLSISQLVSGATASVAQQRLLKSLYDAAQARNVILYIDNVHELIGISATGGEGLDLGDVLAEVLEKNALYCIVSAPEAEYDEQVKRTKLGSVLSPVVIDEMSDEQALLVLMSKAGFFEAKHKVAFSYQALQKTVEWSLRYIHDEYLPKKAIRILEEVAVFTAQKKGANSLVTKDDVAALLTQKLGIPVSQVSESESDKLLHLEEKLHERIIGQVEAVSAVASAMRRARAELRSVKRPIATLLFLGPTGVGKTELCKALAESYFGSEENMLRLDMSEYQSTADLAKLIGAPGSAQDGYLVGGIKKNPYTIVLLDEFEKAHPDILNIFLQVMEDGRLTSARGETADFTNAIIVATSNAATPYIQSQLQNGVDMATIHKQLFAGELTKYYKPELINRFDQVILFKPLAQEDVLRIARLMVGSITKQLESKGIVLEVTEAALSELATEGFDPFYGARPLRRVMQQKLEDALATVLLERKAVRGDTVVYDAGGQLSVRKK